MSAPALRAGQSRYTETWLALSEANGRRSQSAYRSWSLRPAFSAIRSNSLGQQYRSATGCSRTPWLSKVIFCVLTRWATA